MFYDANNIDEGTMMEMKENSILLLTSIDKMDEPDVMKIVDEMMSNLTIDEMSLMIMFLSTMSNDLVELLSQKMNTGKQELLSEIAMKYVIF